MTVLRRATLAVSAAFILAGFAFASWAARIPQIRDGLDLTPRALGLVLLAVAVGSLVSMPLAGVVMSRIGTARTVLLMTCLAAVGLSVAAVGYQAGVPVVVAGLFLLGIGVGTWDVAMNVEGSAVELALERAIMPRFHAGFSVGTVAGALLASLMVAIGVSTTAHLLAVAASVAVIGPLATRHFLPPAPVLEKLGDVRSPLRAWTEPRTLLIGLFVFTAAFTEGTGNDWLAVAMIDGHGTAAAVGSLTFAVFLAAMTAGRWFGPGLIDRHGRVPVIRVLAVSALVGLALVVFSGSAALAVAGAALWGLGIALGFPVGMSAAGDDPAQAAARVSVVSSIGYVAFLTGPPLIGFLGDEIGVLKALTVAGGLIAIGLMVSGVLRAPDVPGAPPRRAADPAEALAR